MADNGDWVLVAPDGWDGDVLELGWISHHDGRTPTEVSIGTPLLKMWHGYWEAVEPPVAIDAPSDFVAWQPL